MCAQEATEAAVAAAKPRQTAVVVAVIDPPPRPRAPRLGLACVRPENLNPAMVVVEVVAMPVAAAC